jgi:hypothetical protein
LKKYQTHSPLISGKDYRQLLLRADVRQLLFRDYIASIEKGETIENDRLPSPH